MKDLKLLSNIELKEVNGGQDEVLSGYPGQSLVNFVWSVLEGAYQKGVNDSYSNDNRCY